ncbi:hypothetical protein TNCV_4027601 [Trichonephila clavipes]|nr:hypothetical protein TNCV_4027601 [Trichonephila clavipes]
MIFIRTWNRWIQNGNGRLAGSQWPSITSRSRRQACFLHDLNESCSLVTSLESRIGVFCKTPSVYTNCSMTFAAAWTLSAETMDAVTLDAASQTGAS